MGACRMIALPSLYPHQVTQVDATRAALARGPAIICANPGVGKTRMAKWIMGSAASKPVGEGFTGSSVFCVHRRSLVDNASQSFNEEPRLPHGLIMSGRDTDWRHRVQVGSIDTMVSWYVSAKYESDHTFDLVVFDECHAHVSKLFKWLKAHNGKRAELGLKPTVVVGLSATPQAKGLGDLFKSIITGPTTDWLIENGFLSKFSYMRAKEGQLGLLVKRGGEFTDESQHMAFGGLGGDLVRDWMQYAQGRPTVGFFPRLSHAREARDRLSDAGVRAEYVDGDTPDDERRDMFRDLDRGTIDYICNVGVIERGTNIPAISCVQLCLAIGSVVRYKQMIGRGSRISPAKQDTLILDHGGNVKRHGFFEDEIPWTLDVTKNPVKEHKTRPTITCPQCERIYRGGTCTACGYAPTHKERMAQGLDFTGSELVPLERNKKTGKRIKSNEEILVESLYRAGVSGRTWKQALGIAYRTAEQQGTKFRVPRKFTVGGRDYNSLPYGHPDGARRVSAIYDFV